ncbi:MAG: hypothetical protein H9535_19185 [Ignavibacteria bacterium]|nr:hypothetical protein [Ignavibacteria bacterium]MBL7991579.1 hypothetical protein [Candidatus Kapabacteria bacterium]
MHSVWQTDEGLPHHSVLTLRQTSDGYIWLGTHEGLARFDGLRFTVFNNRNTPAIRENSIGKIWEDSKGRLWGNTIEHHFFYCDNGVFHDVKFDAAPAEQRWYMGFMDRADTLWATSPSGLYAYANGTSRKIECPADFAHDSIMAMAQDSSGRIWLGGRHTLAVYSQGTVRSVPLPEGLDNVPVYSMIVARDSTLWITCGKSIASLRGETWTVYAFGRKTYSAGVKQFPVEPRRFLLADSKGRVWLRTLAGLYYVQREGGNDVWYPLTTAEGLLETDAFVMQEEANGAIWIGLHNSGVQIWQNGALTTLTAENGNLSHNAIRSLWLGREGEYWIGTNNGGLNRLRRGSVEMLDTESGLGMDKAFAVMQSRDGTLWVATAGAGAYKFVGKTVEAITENHGLGHNIVRSLYEDREGRMWFGTSGGGVQCFDVQRKRLLESLNEQNGFCNNIVYSIYEDKAGGMWFATERGLAYRRTKGDSITTFSTANGLTYNRIRCLAQDSAGVVWVGTGYGLNGFVDGKLTVRYTAENGFAGNNRVFSMYADADTVLWLGTFNSGLFRLKHGVFTQFTQANGLFDDVVYSIAEDARGQLWMSCNRGIYKVSKQLLNDLADNVERGEAMGRIACEVFTKQDGLNDNECNSGSTPSVWVLQDGRLAFPTLGGVALLHPDRILRNTLPPKVIIEEVLADTVRLLPAIDASNDVVHEVEYDKNNFEFRYTATSLLAAERVRFKFMLEGYDKGWIHAEGRRVAYYTNLPSGNYRFRVQACNNDGVWNEQGAMYAFRIAVPWWASWWAWGAYTVSVGSLGFVLLRYRDRRQRMKILATQREREAEIVRRKNEELERANQELRILNDEKNEFLGIAAHDLKNPIAAITSFVELLLNEESSLSEDDRRAYLKTIMLSSERMFDIITNLLDINAIERGAIALRPTNIQIMPVITSLVEMYCSRAEQKNITLHTEISSSPDTSAYVDERALVQILDNLISNAIKYSPLGKNVVVRIKDKGGDVMMHGTEKTGTNEPSLFLLRPSSFVRIEVQDEGEGISPDDMTKLFGKFARLSVRPTGGEHSTGLGLSIVKKMVEAMNGYVWCESEVGKGATFIVELPKVSEQ